MRTTIWGSYGIQHTSCIQTNEGNLLLLNVFWRPPIRLAADEWSLSKRKASPRGFPSMILATEQFHLSFLNWCTHSYNPNWVPSTRAQIRPGLLRHKLRWWFDNPGIRWHAASEASSLATKPKVESMANSRGLICSNRGLGLWKIIALGVDKRPRIGARKMRRRRSGDWVKCWDDTVDKNSMDTKQAWRFSGFL